MRRSTMCPSTSERTMPITKKALLVLTIQDWLSIPAASAAASPPWRDGSPAFYATGPNAGAMNQWTVAG